MDIFFSQGQLVNSFEGSTIGLIFENTYGLVCFNKNHIKAYLIQPDGNLLLVFSDFLLENIIQVEKYPISNDKDGIIILFESSKLTLFTFNNFLPQIISLKYFEKNELNLRKQDVRFFRTFEQLGMAKISKYCFSMFSLNNLLYKTNVFKFVDIDEKIKNVIDFVFLDNYNTPTICLIYNSKQCAYVHKKDVQALIFSYDAKISRFNVMEEFQVPVDTHKTLFSKNTLVFISHNDIVFRTSNSCYAVGLNKMAQNQENVMCDIVLLNEVAFFEEETLIVFNGDGTLFKIKLDFDSKRIIGVVIQNLGKYLTPKFISNCRDFVFIGGYECSLLCTKKSVMIISDTKQLTTTLPNCESGEYLEYKKIFHNNLEKNHRDELKLDVLSVFNGIGIVNDFSMKDRNYLLFSSAGIINGVVEATKCFNIKETLKIEINNKYTEIVAFEDTLVAFGNMKTDTLTNTLCPVKNNSFNQNLTTLSVGKFKECVYQISSQKIFVYGVNGKTNEFELKDTVNYAKVYSVEGIFIVACLDDKNILILYDYHLSKLIDFYNVESFCIIGNICFMLTQGSLKAYNLIEAKFSYIVENILNHDDVYFKNDKNVPFSENDPTFASANQIFGLKIDNINYIFLIDSMGECVIYSEISMFFVKVNTKVRYLKFDVSKKVCITKCNNFIFMNNQSPVVMTLSRNEAVFYECSLNFEYVAFFQECYYILTEENILKCNVDDVEAHCIAHSNEIFDNKSCKCSSENKTCPNIAVDTVKNDDKKSQLAFLLYDSWIFRKFYCLRTPKNIVSVGNYFVIASCSREVYKPDENIDQGIPVETYRYFIDLYNKDFIYLASYDLDADEYVYDLKYLSLNDPVGKKGRSDFLVVCTTKIEGEDKQSRGRLIVLELTTIVADVSSLYKDKKLKLFASENIKGCITGCDEIKGNIAVCLGIKLMVFKIDRSEGLVPIAIHDLYTLSTSISVIKNYLLVSDIYRGLSFFYYQKKPIRLNLLCTSEPIENAIRSDFLIKDNEVAFVCANFDGNLYIYTYSPNNILGEGGTKMIKRYAIEANLGTLKKGGSFSKLDSLSYVSSNNFHVSLIGLSSRVYIMLFKLQSQVLQYYQPSFGLHPQNYLNTRDHNAPVSLKKPIYKILIQKFLGFDIATQRKILKNINVEKSELYSFLNDQFNK